MKNIEDILKACLRYEYFLIDIWGVMHDGGRVFDHAKHLLKTLKDNGKKIALFSNSPRRVFKIEKHLENIGLARDCYDHLITSGEMFYKDLKNRHDNHFSHLEGPFGIVDHSIDVEYFSQLDLNIIEDYMQAKVLVLYAVDHLTDQELDALNHHVLNHKPVILCPNGDSYVFSNNVRVIRPGAPARFYQDHRVETYIYGKPSYRFFNYAYKVFQSPGKQDFLVIGDCKETDVVGALRFGFDSLLVNPGLERIVEHYRI